MNGDLTRSTFDPGDEFTAVRAQQGRVTLDADHNEQIDIQLYDTRTGRALLVGGSGAPADDAGFAVTVDAGVPHLGAGAYLVDGIRVRNGASIPLGGAQPFLPGNNPYPSQNGAWLAYLEVWERPLTAVEEPSIREVALGGPDTTLRDQAVWQVRWLRVGDADTGNCAVAAAALQDLAADFDGTLQPRLAPSGVSGPCIVSDAAAFRGLENQLYRVEIHAGNIAPDGSTNGQTPTFKWSRDNGAVVASAVALVSTSPIVLQIERLGPGGAAGFEIGRSVEIRDEQAVLRGEPGILAGVDDVKSDALQITLLNGSVAALQAMLARPRVVVRRWDSAAAVQITGTFQPLEDGLEVRLDTNGRYRTGDFWSIPARTAALPGTGQQLDWPFSAPDFVAQKSQGPARRRVPLALLDLKSGTWSLRSDCRKLFPPLTSIWALELAGGDGQHGRSGQWLPAPLTAVLTRGSAPVPDAMLRFKITGGAGKISDTDPSAPSPVTQVDVKTDSDGRARVYFRLGPGPTTRAAGTAWEPSLAQTVEVRRIGPAGTEVGPALTFVAQALDHFNLQIAGGNGQKGRPGETLEIALRARVDDGQRPVQNAVVEFELLNRSFEGQDLTQAQGGCVHASANFVSGTKWTNGNLYHTVRTKTDASGVAQVQWKLGEFLSLPTQLVEARLLDGAGNPTAQTALYLAQLDLAREIAWEPLVPWLDDVTKDAAPPNNVQAAIDALANRLEQIAASTTAFDPFLGLEWRSTVGGTLTPVDTSTNIPLQHLAALVFRSDLVPPVGRDITQTSQHSGVRVYAEVPDPNATSEVARVVQLKGNVHKAQNGRWEWTLSSKARSTLDTMLTAVMAPNIPSVIAPLRVTVVPRWLPGGIPTDSSAVHELLLRVTKVKPPS